MKPSPVKSRSLALCCGRGTLPGALTSTKPICPPGNRTALSGMPSKPGLTNLTARPPRAFASAISFCSVCFSLIKSSFTGVLTVMLRSAAVVYRTFSYTVFFASKKSFVYDRQRPQHQSSRHCRKSSKSPLSALSRSPFMNLRPLRFSFVKPAFSTAK